MNKVLLALALLAFSIPHISFADGDFDPRCFENPKGSYAYSSDLRGTCKLLEASTVISIDPALKGDFFLGTHGNISAGCYPDGCSYLSKYSEDAFLTSSSSITDAYHSHPPVEYALFEKSFFAPILSNAFKNAHLSFSADSMPTVAVRIFKKSELEEIQKQEKNAGYPDQDYRTGVLLPQVSWITSAAYKINVLDYQEYGKHIFSPKGSVVESQYVDLGTDSPPNDTDLQIFTEPGYKGRGEFFVVPVTSPLTSIKSYWLYAKENGKFVLKWDKSEYGLDNGETRVVTSADKNVTAALLFSDSFGKKAATTSTGATSSAVASSTQEGEKKGFFVRIIDFILSWFR